MKEETIERLKQFLASMPLTSMSEHFTIRVVPNPSMSHIEAAEASIAEVWLNMTTVWESHQRTICVKAKYREQDFELSFKLDNFAEALSKRVVVEVKKLQHYYLATCTAYLYFTDIVEKGDVLVMQVASGYCQLFIKLRLPA